MPWYYRRWRYPTRRRRRTWRRGPRKIFRRRFWRRRHRVRRYRQRKLRKITVKEYQPKVINRLKIKGLMPLFMCNHERRTNNLTQWLYSKTPEHFPGGGGFSITNFTLAGLYELHDHDLNWWTKSNCKLPLIRYLYCKLRLYRQYETDYVFRYLRCYPMKSTNILYMSMQPSMMMMNTHTIFVPCIKDNPKKKPYVNVKIMPPEQMTTKWYFQHDLANTPLLTTLCSAASFTRYYTSSDAISTTIGFFTLNTNIFQTHNYQYFPTTGWHPKNQNYMWALKNGTHDYQNEEVQNLIYLGNTGPYEKGHTINECIPSNTTEGADEWQKKLNEYFSNKKWWGNPFVTEYLTQEVTVLYSTLSPSELRTQHKFKNKTDKLGTSWQLYSDPLIYYCRYNPLEDTGKDCSIYLLPNLRDESDLRPLINDKLKNQGFPLWLLTFGWLDWQKQQSEVQQIDINYLNVLTCPTITPKLQYYIPIDKGFLNKTSPYQPEHVLSRSDTQHYYVKTAFQLQTINLIGSSGPGIVKLQGEKSCEAKMEYRFHFKLGGCPAAMEQVCDPTEQPKYPIPSNLTETNSLQNPETPPEYFLYSFDQKRDQLTKSAIERITKDWETKESTSTFTGSKLQLPTTSRESPPTSDETTSEEEEETLQQKLNKQRRKQRLLKLKILSLLKLTKSSKSLTAE
nr:MAG: ORF1 [TTV-like mini virus]